MLVTQLLIIKCDTYKSYGSFSDIKRLWKLGYLRFHSKVPSNFGTPGTISLIIFMATNMKEIRGTIKAM